MALEISGISASEAGKGRTFEWVAMAIGVVILIGAPYVIYPVFLMELLCMALFACAFNLLIGGGGLLSFGHAAFFGGGAYIAAETAKEFGFPFELALLAGIVTATFLGLIAGLVAIRRSGLIFAMVTLALAQAIYFLALRLPFTHSEDGIQAVPRGWLLRRRRSSRQHGDVLRHRRDLFPRLSAGAAGVEVAVRPGACAPSRTISRA